MKEYLERNYLNEETTLKSWLFTLDHKRIGLMYFFAIMLFFMIAGFIGLFIRLELLTPFGGDIVDAKTYNVLFTLHGAIMIFMFIIPTRYFWFWSYFICCWWWYKPFFLFFFFQIISPLIFELN